MRTQHSDPKFILYSYHEILNCDISVVGHSARTFVCSLLPHVDCTIQCENYRKDRMFVPFILACTGYPYTMYSSLNDSQDNCSFEFSGHPTNGNWEIRYEYYACSQLYFVHLPVHYSLIGKKWYSHIYDWTDSIAWFIWSAKASISNILTLTYFFSF